VDVDEFARDVPQRKGTYVISGEVYGIVTFCTAFDLMVRNATKDQVKRE